MDEEAPRRRKAWFQFYLQQLDRSIGVPATDATRSRCPCCHYLTLAGRGDFEICPVCFWEDDGQDDHDADIVRGGPNGSLSLHEARENYLALGACEASHIRNVRPARPDEEGAPARS